MSLEKANIIVLAMAIYAAIGLIFALAFVTFGAPKIDPAAKGMPLRARLIILPGAALLWPLMLTKWVTQTAPPVS